MKISAPIVAIMAASTTSSVAGARMRSSDPTDLLCPIVQLYLADQLAQSALHVVNNVIPIAPTYLFQANEVALDTNLVNRLQKWIIIGYSQDIILMDFDGSTGEDANGTIEYAELVECFMTIVENLNCADTQILFQRYLEGNRSFGEIVRDSVDSQLQLISLATAIQNAAPAGTDTGAGVN